MPRRTFPPDFVWGVATSSYQIEGAAFEDGRKASIWDTFCRTPGKVADGDHGDVACDHYHRWRDDIQLMKRMGMQAYRFSVAWPRVLPDGTGAVNEAGLDFYEKLVDGLLEAGITPWATLYHWDLPQAQQDRGGWPDRAVVDAFVRYADVVSRRLGDRVGHWITHNEPWCICHLGHLSGEHAPGIQDGAQMLRAAHHVLLSHGRAVPVIRRNSPGSQVGITLNLQPTYPASPSMWDVDAARKVDAMFNRWWLDPLYGRGYPTDHIHDHVVDGHLDRHALPFVEPGDLDEIAVETDFLGINNYSRSICRSATVPEAHNLPPALVAAPAEEHTDIGWEVAPTGLRDLLLRVHRDYGPERIVITENGASYNTPPDPDGAVRDTRRQAYFAGHLDACHQAIEQGAPLVGYFGWSLMDNFEWAYGYAQRFGLTWVDYDTLERTPKQSFHFYKGVVEANALPDGE